MKLTVSKDIAALRTAAVGRVYAVAGSIRARFATNLPAQDMIYLEKASEARRYLDAYPTYGSDPDPISADPVSGYPFIVSEIGITADSGWEIAQFYVQGAALFRQAGAVIDGIRLGYGKQIEAAANPAEIAALEAAAYAAFAAIPIPTV
jgi:hypothetical protein